MFIRPEQPSDRDAITSIILAAFHDHPHSQQNEQRIVTALRADHALTVSLVAIEGDEVVGHIACSPVSINEMNSKWFGLGPVAVQPNRQHNGIGAALVRASIAQLVADNAGGTVLLGDPTYYQRFGFAPDAKLILPGVPASHFLCLALGEPIPAGLVAYHSAFSV